MKLKTLQKTLDDQIRQTIAEKLHDEKTISGYGRAQHGLNGKDADLESQGQCVVDRLRIRQDKFGLWLEAELHQYASVCPQEDDNDEKNHQKVLDQSQELAWAAVQAYRGEWEGSYWIFVNRDLTARCPITPHEYQNDGASQHFLGRIAARLLKAINANPAVPAFEKRMAKLNADMDALNPSNPAPRSLKP